MILVVAPNRPVGIDVSDLSEATSHNLMRPSMPAEAKRLESPDQARQWTVSLWPRSSLSKEDEARSQTLTRLSSPAEANSFPLGEKAKDIILPR